MKHKEVIGIMITLTFLMSGCQKNEPISSAPQQNQNPAQVHQSTNDPVPNPVNPPSQNTTSQEKTTGESKSASNNVISNLSPLDTESSDLIVEQFFYDINRKDYDAAWDLIHQTVHQNPSGSLTKEAFLSFFKSFNKEVSSAKVVKHLDEYKFPSVQLTLSNVDVVETKFKDGSVFSLHLAQNPNKGWRLFWSPQNGLE